MTRRPKEPRSWETAADQASRELREGVESAKARMIEHRRQMRAAGLVGDPPAGAEPSDTTPA